MHTEGILVGCDQKQEWLLPWWWQHYSVHNHYPVIFVDFGMTQNALKWCLERGKCISIQSSKIDFSEVLPEKKESWEGHYGESVWLCRNAWFKKSLALLQSPFSIGIWIDLDCQINGSLEPLFHSLVFGSEIALAKEPEFIQKQDEAKGFLLPGEINYNSGVIVFRRQAKIIVQWARESFENPREYIGDQQALSRAIFQHRTPVIELPPIYNWCRVLGPNPEAVIYHFTGGKGKIEILQKVHPDLLRSIDFMNL